MRKTVSRVATVTLGLAVIVGASGCAGSDPGSGAEADGGLVDMEPITLSLASGQGADTPTGVAQQEFADFIAEESGGKITVETYFSGALLTLEEQLDGVGAGLADIGPGVSSYTPQLLPISTWTLPAAAAAEGGFPANMFAQSAAFNEVFLGSGDVEAEYTENGVKLLDVVSSSAPYSLICNTPVKSLADIAGKRVRTGGGAWVGEMEALGAIPVSLGYAEIYEGLERGVIDCVLGGVNYLETAGLADIAKYVTTLPTSLYPGQVMYMNLEKFDSLPLEGKQLIQNAAALHHRLMTESGARDYAGFVEYGLDKGVTMINADAGLVKTLTEYQASVIEGLPVSAPDALSDPAGFLDELAAAQERWLAIAEESGIELSSDALSSEEDRAEAASTLTQEALDAFFTRVKEESFDPFRAQ